jgi:hypothetical protein
MRYFYIKIYLNEEYSEIEFKEIKDFINQSFFHVVIPNQIIDIYNRNFKNSDYKNKILKEY